MVPTLSYGFRRLAPKLCLALGLACGCDDDRGPVDPPGDGGVGYDVVIPDGAVPCSKDDDCDDAIECTHDICLELGYCVNRPDHSVCADGVFCNGPERCDVIEGCVVGPREGCNDENVCTVNVCDEDTKSCLSAIRDFDEDGEADWHCEGGTDCDDTNPSLNSSRAEVCGDGIDNDCDTIVDEADCGGPAHDTCADALDVSGGGSFALTTERAGADYPAACSSSYRDLVLVLTLAEPQDLDVYVSGEGVLTAVAIRTDCEVRLSEVSCESGYPAELRRRSLPAGTYYLIVAASGSADREVDVDLSTPTPLPTNETCATALDITDSLHAEDSFIDVSDDIDTSCGAGGVPDLAYRFTLAEQKDVRVTLTSVSGEALAFSVRSACEDAATQLRCTRGDPASSRLYRLEAGTYYVIVEGSDAGFALDLDLLDPTDAPAGESCDAPIALALNTETPGTLVDRGDDHALGCGYYNRDAVYSFELTERKDVTVRVEAPSEYVYVSLRTVCGNDEDDLRCVNGRPARMRVRDLNAGMYYLVVEAYAATTYTVIVETSGPTPVVPVTGNESCADAYPVPPEGGVFSGDTTGMANDLGTSLCGRGAGSPDAVYQLDLASSKHVLATTVGSAFDTVLHMHTGTCATGEETLCNDEGGDGNTSLIETTLDAGTYFFVVDGFGSSHSGEYYFEILLSDP